MKGRGGGELIHKTSKYRVAIIFYSAFLTFEEIKVSGRDFELVYVIIGM